MARNIVHGCVLQWDAHHLSLLRFRRQGRTAVPAQYFRLNGTWEDDAQRVAALRSCLEERDLLQDDIYLVLPRYEITTRLLTLPSQDPGEIAGMVRLGAEEYVPYTLDELIIDQCILKTLDSGESLLLAALAHRDVVDRHVSLLREAGVEPTTIFLSTACLLSGVLAAPPSGENRYAVVALTSGGIEFVVLDRRCPVFTRGIATAQDWEEIAGNPHAGPGLGVLDTGGAEELASEIRASLAAYLRESEDGRGVDAIYLCCEYAEVSLLCKALSEQLNRPCTPADFTASLQESGFSHGPGFPVIALGGMLSAQQSAAIPVNLLPKQLAEARRLAGTRRLLLRTGAFALIALGLLCGLYYQAIFQRTRMIKTLEQRIAAIEPSIRGVSEKREQLNILRRQVERKGSLVEQLARLVDAAPEGAVNFTRLTLKRQEGVDLWGRAKTVDDVARFTQGIRNIADANFELFARARSLYEQRIYERDAEVFAYQIEISPAEGEDER